MKTTINNWKLTDSQPMQYVKCSFKSEEGGEYNHYKLIEMCDTDPKKKEFEVFVNELCVDDYLDSMRTELSTILSSYGYGDDEEDCSEIIERMMEDYGDNVFQVVCECIFEWYGSFQAEVLFTGSEQDCIKFIENYCKNN